MIWEERKKNRVKEGLSENHAPVQLAPTLPNEKVAEKRSTSRHTTQRRPQRAPLPFSAPVGSPDKKGQ